MKNTLANQPVDVEIDARALVKSLVRALPYVFVFVGLAIAALYFGLSQIAPKYRAQATILVETGESNLAQIPGGAQEVASVPEPEAVAGQVQLLESRDLARAVAQKLNLETRPEFNPSLRGDQIMSNLLASIGLGRDPSSASTEERVLERFERNLAVFAIRNARNIVVEFVSQDPELAAAGANAVTEEYIALQQAAKRDTSADAAEWLEAEISSLRTKVQEADARLAEAREAELEQSPWRSQLASGEVDEDGVDLQALERDVAEQRELLDSYLRRYREALARQNGDEVPKDARIVLRASVPASPYFPKTGVLTAVATFAALLAAIAFVLMRELASGRPMRRTAVASIPVIPDITPVRGQGRWDDDGDVRRIMPAEPTLAPSPERQADEALSLVVGEILAGGRKRIMVTMAEGSGGNGRPLAAVAIARAIAGADRRPVLIDLRGDGANSASMGEGTNLPGFSDLFAGAASFAQVIFRDRKSRVHFIPGGLHPLAADELADERTSLLLNALDHTYDHVILDVANDVIGTVGGGCDAAVVVSEFGGDDARTIRALERVRAASQAKMNLLVVDPAATEEIVADDLDIAEEGAAA